MKKHSVYSDKFVLSMVDLTQVDLATEEDKKYQIDYWARLFKATTWEEIKMIANKNQYLYEASSTLYQLTAEDVIREQCEQRERYYNRQRGIQMVMESHIDKIISQAEKIESQAEKIENQTKEIEEQNQKIAVLDDEKRILLAQITKMEKLLKKNHISIE